MPELFSKVLPSNQEFDDTRNYAGIYHFRFWVYGFWYDVVVDDYLPVWEADKSLVFCSNREEPNEFWAALLEKVYTTKTVFEILIQLHLNQFSSTD